MNPSSMRDTLRRFMPVTVAALLEAVPKGNAAQQLREHMGLDEPEAYSRQQYRYATPERAAKGRKAGAYGRGLRNWITRKQAAEQSNRMARRA